MNKLAFHNNKLAQKKKIQRSWFTLGRKNTCGTDLILKIRYSKIFPGTLIFKDGFYVFNCLSKRKDKLTSENGVNSRLRKTVL